MPNPDGTPTYQEVLQQVQDSYPTGTTQEIQRPSPQVEALQNILGPQLASFLGNTY